MEHSFQEDTLARRKPPDFSQGPTLGRFVLWFKVMGRWLLFLLYLASVQAEKYTLKDLEVLVAQKNYWEFLGHARDIRPGLRDKHWKEMVQEMATQIAGGQFGGRSL